MAEAGDPEIDILVMGLPVNQYLDEARRTYLATKYKGELDVGGGKTVIVRDVLVQPQPMGGFIELGTHMEGLNDAILRSNGALQPLDSTEQLHDLSILMVDPGEHTLDWLLIQEGLPHTKASGAASDAGRHRVVRAVLEALQAKVGRPLPPATLPRINEALRTGKPLKLAGEAHDLREFEGVIRSAVEDPINRLVEGMRGMHEVIDIIALVGGHPERYRDVLADRFPAIPVYVVEESVLANVRGFQLIGQAQLLAAEAQPLAA
jgi:plasmid segregation protein ParM